MLALILAGIVAGIGCGGGDTPTPRQLVRYGGQYHEKGVTAVTEDSALAYAAYRIGNKRASGPSQRIFERIDNGYGDPFLTIGAVSETTGCAQLVLVFKSIWPHRWNVQAMDKHCPE